MKISFLGRLVVLGCLSLSLIVLAEPKRRDTPPRATGIKLQTIVTGLERPIRIGIPHDGTGRIFIEQQIGLISVVENGKLLDEPFLDIRDKVSTFSGFSEQGLFGIAFHPDYKNNGKFYVHYSHRDDPGASIVEYHVSKDNPNKADPDSARVIMEINQSGTDHYGGQLAFGPDGYFYIGKGDGSGPEDADRTGQNTNVLNGKILRINVDKESASYGLVADNPFVGTGKGANEVWAYGLRNPHTFSFDTATGDLYIGDVGENMIEEINYVPAGFKGAPNFGWSHFAGGSEVFNEDQPAKPDMIAPIFEYTHTEERCAVTGGYVYHGKALPQLDGVYLYADWCSGDIYYLYQDSDDIWNSGTFMDVGLNITGFGTDEDQELYFVYYSLSDMKGGLVKLVPDK